MKIVARFILLFVKIFKRILMVILKYNFKKSGKNVIFDPFGIYTYKTITIGNDVYIGPGANFSASKSFIEIGNKVMFGPNVTIRGGNHNTNEIGYYMYDVKEKRENDDLPVIIKDDVWVGTGVIILKGVTIERGSIIAAGAVVNKDVPPYSIIGGIPGKIIKRRFADKDLVIHEKKINDRK